MPVLHVAIHRFNVVSMRPFEEVVREVAATIGRPDMREFQASIASAISIEDVRRLVQGAIGASELMEFARYSSGDILRLERGGAGPRILRLIVGNPLIMKEMVRHVPDAASYAPVTILIDERADGVHLSYDTMTSQLAPYGSEPALAVARELDSKIEALLDSTCRERP
jgi:hypothetical protein